MHIVEATASRESLMTDDRRYEEHSCREEEAAGGDHNFILYL